MVSTLRPALVLLTLFTLLTGFVYPSIVTGIAKVAFADKATGSFLVRDGKVVGSRLIGQSFEGPGHLWGRLSGTAPAYNASSSSGTNYGPLHPTLVEAAKARIEALRAADPEARTPVPVDLVTASGSGLDPHISPAAAEYQVRRIARARHLDEGSVRAIIAHHTEGRTLGILGEPRVNVLEVNLELDSAR
jgi:K+-transporting ATPase ATPase C chain